MGNNIKKLHSSEEIKKHYDIREKLGTGSFAVVKRAVSKRTGEEFAIKIIKKSKLNFDELQTVHDEVEIMHKVHHQHAVQLIEMYESKKKIWMVMEILTGGELFDRIVSKGCYSEKEASEVVKGVASALEYLHGVGITHRDLKPENLLYKSPDPGSPIKLTDFGLAKYRSAKEQDGGMITACGTPGYVSPEIVMNIRYTSKTDVWSLGVIIYILLCGFPPFYSESTHELYQQIKAGDYSFPAPYWSDISAQAKDLIKHCLQVDPTKRYTATQVLQHPWVGGKDVSTKAIAGGHIKRLIVLQARRRLRKGMQMVIAINRFARVVDEERRARTGVGQVQMQVVGVEQKVGEAVVVEDSRGAADHMVVAGSGGGAVVVHTVQHSFAAGA